MLEFQNLRAGYEGTERLHGISARLEPGRFTAISGPNGCGKSTLLKCAAGLLKPLDGGVFLDDQSIQSLSDRQRARQIAYMPQSRIVPDIPVRQLVMHGRYPHLKWGQNPSSADQDIVDAAIERVKLGKLAMRSVSRLSGGERQRAYIAMMLAQQTQVMLLDEPTTHLDLSSQFALMELMRELCAEGRCIGVVLHDLALALEYADTMLLMRDGALAAQGTPEAVYRSGRIQDVFDVGIRRAGDGKYLFYADKPEE